MSIEKIDFIMPWVDGNDAEWQKEKAKYNDKVSKGNIDASAARYRDWDNLQYWFRGVEKYTPWVNKIHFVTYGHLPKWLNTDHPQLHIVNHRDFIPEKYLPVFSVNPIELNIHRIPGLSNHFVYFNDDCFIVKEIEQRIFFKNGLPCDTAALSVLGSSVLTQDIPILNAMHVVNKYFDKHKIICIHKKKWLSLKNGSQMIRTLLLLPWKFIPNIYNAHGPNAYTKKVFNTLWEKEYELLDQTCKHKFREIEDVTQILMKDWQICEGEFEPRKVCCRSENISMGHNKIEKLIFKGKTPIICLNDDNSIRNFEELKADVNGLLNRLLPEKSSYEI